MPRSLFLPALIALGVAACPPLARAQDSAGPATEALPALPAEADTAPGNTLTQAPETNSGLATFFSHWFDRVNQAQASQPSWMTPLVTITPRLEEEVRYDQYWEKLPNGSTVDNFDTGKGLELIPTTTNEIIVAPPVYLLKTAKGRTVSGWGDGPTVLLKQRLFSQNAAHGDRIVTAFLAVSGSAGGRHFTDHTTVITPTLAAGQGFGALDVQATTGVAIPMANLPGLGAQWQNNVAFQAHVLQYFWPECEVNDTVWLNGSQRGGKNQIFLTPGIIFGRFPIAGRLKAILGVGYQFAISPKTQFSPEIVPLYNHNWILTARMAF